MAQPRSITARIQGPSAWFLLTYRAVLGEVSQTAVAPIDTRPLLRIEMSFPLDPLRRKACSELVYSRITNPVTH